MQSPLYRANWIPKFGALYLLTLTCCYRRTVRPMIYIWECTATEYPDTPLSQWLPFFRVLSVTFG